MTEQAAARAGEEQVRRLQLPLPKPFDGRPENWQKWRQRFERYRTGTALEEGKLVSTFLYSMGNVADDILATLTGVDESTTAYVDLLAAFDAHFGGRKNTIFARVKFNRRVQRVGETVDNFIQDLHKLAEDCEYGALKDELIRDRIVVGVTDDDLSNLLQTKANLTLAEAIQSSRQAETRKEGRHCCAGTKLTPSGSKHVTEINPSSGPSQTPPEDNSTIPLPAEALLLPAGAPITSQDASTAAMNGINETPVRPDRLFVPLVPRRGTTKPSADHGQNQSTS